MILEMNTIEEFVKELKDKKINVCRISNAIRNTYFEYGDKNKLPAQNFLILITAKIGDKDIMRFRVDIGTVMIYDKDKLKETKEQTLKSEKALIKRISKQKITVKQGRWVNE